MLTKKLSALAVGGAALFALSVTIGVKASQAQGTDTGQVAAPPQQRQGQYQPQPGQGGSPRPDQPGFGQGFPGQPGQPGFPGQPGQMRPMGGGGGMAAMVEDNGYLYILQGGRLMKVQKSDLKVTAETFLMGPGGPGGFPREGRPGEPGQRNIPPAGAGPRPPQ
jgi:collagen type IV alpha